MAKSNDGLLLKVKADDAQVKKLTETLQSHTATIKEQKQAYTSLEKTIKANATTEQLMKGEWNQSVTAIQNYKKNIKEVNAELGGYAETVKAAKMEKKMFRFAVTELMGSFDGLSEAMGGNEEKMKKVNAGLKGGVESAFGLKFAFYLMGGVFAEIATPIAIVIGLFTALSILTKKEKEEIVSLKDAYSDFDKMLSEMNLKQLKGAYETAKIRIEQIEADRKARNQKNTFSGRAGLFGSLISNALQVGETEEEKLLKEQMAKIVDLTIAGEKKIAEEKKKADQQMTKDFMAGIKLRNELREQDAERNAGLDYNGRPILQQSTSKKNGKIKAVGVKEVGTVEWTESVKEEMNKTANNYQEYLINPMLGGLNQVANAWENQFAKNLNATFRNGKTVMDQFFIGLLSELNRVIERALIMQGIFSLMSLIPGGGAIANSLGFTNILGRTTSSSKGRNLETYSNSTATSAGAGMMQARRANGMQSVHITGSFVQRGSDLVAVVEHSVLKRNTRSMSISGS